MSKGIEQILFRRKTHIDGKVREELRNPEVNKVWHEKGFGFYAHLLDSKDWMDISALRGQIIKYEEDFPLDCTDKTDSKIENILIGLGELLKVDVIEYIFKVI